MMFQSRMRASFACFHVPLMGLAALAGCTAAAPASVSQLPANSCPLAGWTWVRWNDAYGLNVVGIVQALPGWTFAFSPNAAVLNANAGEESAVRIVLVAKPIGASVRRQGSDEHVYGYWSHATLGAKPNWVEVECGKVTLERLRSAPRDLFNPVPQAPPPTHPPMVGSAGS